MEHAQLFTKMFDDMLKREKEHPPAESEKSHKVAHIYLVYQQAKGPFTESSPVHYTIGTNAGATILKNATDTGIIKRQITSQKLTYNELSWMELGHNARDIVKNISKLDEAELMDRIEIAAPHKVLKARV